MTEFEKGYEQGYKDGVAGAALPNVNDNGDKIDGYGYAYKTDSHGEPYIHIDNVRSMLKKATDVQPVDRWISVKDRLPNDGERVIVYTVEDSVLEMKFDKRRERWGRVGIDGVNWFGQFFITHWQPLPEPPKDGDVA